MSVTSAIENEAMSSVLFRAKLLGDQETPANDDTNEDQVLVQFSSGDIQTMTSCARPTMEKRRKFTATSANAR